MISKKKTKEIADKFDKKINKKALEKLEKEILEIINLKIKNASMNADFKGRKIILPEDLTEYL
jgi:histone H3/H4